MNIPITILIRSRIQHQCYGYALFGVRPSWSVVCYGPVYGPEWVGKANKFARSFHESFHESFHVDEVTPASANLFALPPPTIADRRAGGNEISGYLYGQPFEEYEFDRHHNVRKQCSS